jgi:hypothetical protein
MMGKMNMSIPLIGMCKTPTIEREVLRTLKVPVKVEDPPMILNTMYHGQQREDNPPFYLYLGVNGIRLNNSMLDSGASTNVMSMKVIKAPVPPPQEKQDPPQPMKEVSPPPPPSIHD